MIGLGVLPGARRSEAYDVSADGSVVVGSSPGNDVASVFRWTTEAGMAGIGPPLPFGEGNIAHAVSADGSIVVGNAPGPFRWTTVDGFAYLGAGASFAYGVSADGSTVVGDGAYVWTEQTGAIDIGGDAAYDVSADGSVAVGAWYGGEAAVWDLVSGEHGRLKPVLEREYGLDLDGWMLFGARAVSDDGLTIVGSGLNPAGDPEAWRVTLSELVIPEPGTAGLVVLGLSALATRRRATR
jgi:uncharacterized membrane protein